MITLVMAGVLTINGQCYVERQIPNPQPPKPRGEIRLAKTPDEIARYNAWYREWAPRQVELVPVECARAAARGPGSCVITVPPSERPATSAGRMPARLIDPGPVTQVPEPSGLIAWLCAWCLMAACRWVIHTLAGGYHDKSTAWRGSRRLDSVFLRRAVLPVRPEA